MTDKEMPTILDQNMMVEDGEPHSVTAIANRIEGNQKVWDTEIREIFRCLRHGPQNQGNSPSSIKT
jgi:hypothetical protein